MSEMKDINYPIPAQLKQKLDVYAAVKGISKQDIVKRALEHYLNEREEYNIEKEMSGGE